MTLPVATMRAPWWRRLAAILRGIYERAQVLELPVPRRALPAPSTPLGPVTIEIKEGRDGSVRPRFRTAHRLHMRRGPIVGCHDCGFEAPLVEILAVRDDPTPAMAWCGEKPPWYRPIPMPARPVSRLD